MSTALERQETTLVPPQTAAGQRSVLLVDDDESVARTLERVLKVAGFDVVMAKNGPTAIQAIARPFDVILTDIHMPGMTGVELLRVVRAHDLDVPVILMTGDPSVETAVEAVSLGALQYLVKPVPNKVLVKAVERASRLHRIAQIKREALQLAGAQDGMLAGDRAGLQTRFENALSTMWLAFQPIVDAKQKRIYGYEALMRAKEPSLPHPGAVLAAAERLDLLPELGRRVRGLAAEAFKHAPDQAVIFVNLHTRDLLDPELYEGAAPLSQFAHRVVLEITERAAIDDVKDIQARVSVLRYNGFRIAIDDLGAGYAGLSSFAALEPEIVKLDMSLVRNVHQSVVRQRLIASMTTLCREMGMLVVAEGVEVAEERACVLSAGCDLLQGYLLAKPGPPFPAVEGISPS